MWRFNSSPYGGAKLVTGLAAAALLGAVGVARVQTEDPAPEGFTFDSAPVAVVVGGHKLRIPRSYLSDFVPGKANQTSITLLAHLPDLSSISVETVPCFVNRMACDEIVSIEISDMVVPSGSEQLKRLLQGRRARIRSGPYGLKRYVTRTFDAQQDTYGRALRGGQFYLVACLKQPSPFDTCTYQQSASVNLSLKYVFRRTQLRNWESIHRGIIELLASFRQS
ncbi:MAG TPA: hypothetical protein VJR47_20635 [Stellaceae bacterium]|nr:hypothetical protein [Stellaceae bacterium]